MQLKQVKRAPVLITAGVVGLFCAVQALHPGLVERLEWMTYDWRVRGALRVPSTVATNLAFVSISDDSLKALNNRSLISFHAYGKYWPRHLYGRVTRELAGEGAKAVAFDILFGELHPEDAPVAMGGTNFPVESDEYFARQMVRAGNVLLASEHGILPPLLFQTNATAIADITAEKDLDGVLRRARAFEIYTNWSPLFRLVGEDAGYGVDLGKAVVEARRIVLPRSEGEPIVFPLDEKGRFDATDFATNLPPGMERWQMPFTRERVWHMGIVLAARELGLDLTNAEVDLEHGRIQLRGPGVERTIPVDADGYFYINWRLKVDDPRLACTPFEVLLAQDLKRLQGETNGLEHPMRGKLVVVGSTATGNDLTDRGATPLQKDTFLVSKHWNVASSIITGEFIRRAGPVGGLLCVILPGLAAALLTWKLRLRPLRALFSVLAVLLLYTAFSYVVFVESRWWLPLVTPATGGLFTHLFLLAYLVLFEQAEQRRVRSVFSKVVSPGVVQELLQLEKLSLRGARRNVTVFFSDIRGFTEMTDVNREKAAEHVKEHQLTGEAAEACFEEQAQETLDTVNQYLSVIAEQVIKHQGTIDKFIGDCVMAFWGAPTANPRHALDCVRAAIDMQRAVYALNREREEKNRLREEENVQRAAAGQPPLPKLATLAVGSGINTGAVTVGLMGSDAHGLNYTVFGREVNLASRLETVSGRGRIIISEATFAELIRDDPRIALACVKLNPEKVKGIRDAVQIYEVPWRTDEHPPTGGTTPPFAGAGEDNTGFLTRKAASKG